MNTENKALSFWIYLPCIIAFSLSLDIIIPGVPLLVKYFHSDQADLQLILSLFMLMLGLGQLVFGWLTDRFPLKRIMVISALIYTGASIICYVANSLEMLLIGRMLQGIGVSGLFVAVFTIVRIDYPGEQSSQIYSIFNGTMAASPLFAPFLGSYLIAHYGWRSPFLFLSLFSLINITVALMVRAKNNASNVNYHLSDFLVKLKNLPFVLFISLLTINSVGLFLFFSVSPYLLLTILQTPIEHFGNYFIVSAVAFILGTIISVIYIKRVHAQRLMRYGMLITLFGAMLMFLANYAFDMTAIKLILTMSICSLGAGMVCGPATSCALMQFNKNLATASSLLGFFQFFMPAIIVEFILFIPVKNIIVLATTFLICAGAMLLTLQWIYRLIK